MTGWPTVFVSTALGLGLVLLATGALPRLQRAFTRLCLATVGDRAETSTHARRSRLLRSLHSSTSHRVHAARSVGYDVGGGVLAGLLAAAVLSRVSTGPTGGPLAWLGPAAGVLAAALGGLVATRWTRRWHLRRRADRRGTRIDESLPRTVAFVYALSRGGIPLPGVMRIVAQNRSAFGESAAEIAVVVADMDCSGADLGTALERAARRSPSEQFADFADNVAGVLASGRNVPGYLREQYDHYREVRLADQEALLSVLAAVGEVYVALFVAGPLFVISILLVFGALTGGLLDLLRLVVYVLVPTATLLFVGYVHTLFRPVTPHGLPRRGDDRPAPRAGRESGARPSGAEAGDESRAQRPPVAGGGEGARRWLAGTPPTPLILVLVAALFLAAGRLWYLGRVGSLTVRSADDVAIQSALLALAAFAGVRTARQGRRRAIEAAMPDFLGRLAAANGAGLPLTRCLRRTDRSDLGPLNVEVGRLVADLEWGGRTERALERFAGRVRSPTVWRIVALLTNAMGASGTLAPVLRIAAEEARQVHRLRRRRRRETFVYRLVIYLAFFVFLGIGVAFQAVLVPAMPAGADGAASGADVTGVAAGPLSIGAGPPKEAYVLVLHHAAVVQAVCSGFVAGLVGEGDVGNGAKHVAAMLLLAYALMRLLG